MAHRCHARRITIGQARFAPVRLWSQNGCLYRTCSGDRAALLKSPWQGTPVTEYCQQWREFVLARLVQRKTLMDNLSYHLDWDGETSPASARWLMYHCAATNKCQDHFYILLYLHKSCLPFCTIHIGQLLEENLHLLPIRSILCEQVKTLIMTNRLVMITWNLPSGLTHLITLDIGWSAINV